jgi:MOSC domain-containing protein YiiM
VLLSQKDTMAHILSINISTGGIPKRPVASACVHKDGLEGDGHNHDKHNNPVQAVCLQDMEKLEEFNKQGYCLKSGATGENLTLRHLNVNGLPLGTILKFSGGVVLELSKVRKPCYVLDAIHPKLKEDIAGHCGMYAKVVQEGTLQVDEMIEIEEPVPLY